MSIISRRIEVKVVEAWAHTHMKDLKVGQTFRMFDPASEGEPEKQVADANGRNEWVVATTPVYSGGVCGVSVVI